MKSRYVNGGRIDVYYLKAVGIYIQRKLHTLIKGRCIFTKSKTNAANYRIDVGRQFQLLIFNLPETSILKFGYSVILLT